MIRKLKTKFVVMAMIALFTLLAVIVIGMNLINYNSLVADADSTLDILSQNEGVFPNFEEPMSFPLPPFMNRETPYETRYFSLLIDENGHVIQNNVSRIEAVDEDTAVHYAAVVMTEDTDRGFIDAYRFSRHEEKRFTRITFLDCGRKLYSYHEFLRASICMSVAGYAVFFFVILFFSGKILRPVTESYEKQKRFITDAGHEIKTPLAIIKADADVLELEYGKNEWLDGIQTQISRLTSLTEDLVYLSQMEEMAQELPMMEFALSDVVEETTIAFQALAQTQQKTLEWTVPAMLSYTGNEKGIRQLVNILLDNALKYSPPDSCIRLSVSTKNRQLTLTVYNQTAQPMSNETLGQLFERFYRGDDSRGGEIRGYGIGLSVAKAIAASHGGRIHASTTDGRSLFVTVELPL